MSTYRLDKLFAPRSVALIGGSTRDRSLGRMVLRNLLTGGFTGELQVVNPTHPIIEGKATVPSLKSLGKPSDVVVITAPPKTVPAIVAEAALMGTAAAVIVTAGLGHGWGTLGDECQSIARRHGLRLVGPNCLGVLVPPIGLNASFAACNAKAGNLALISQSGAVAAGLIQWSINRKVGFSGIVSLGDALDVDFGDLLDYFAVDDSTKAILLYIEAITAPAKFLSAARAAARVKPVIVVKGGRQAQGARAAATHTGALAGSDAVYDAAFQRVGLLRVMDLDELFQAAEALGRTGILPGKRLAILTNGGGIGVLAIDRLIEMNGSASELSPETLAKLNTAMPSGWSKANPVDIIGDADGDRYARALEIILDDPNSDAVLVLNVPTALASASDAAKAVGNVVVGHRLRSSSPKPVFAGWIAEDDASRSAFEAVNLPHYATDTDAIKGFMHLVRFREARDELMRTPPSIPSAFARDINLARDVIAKAVIEQRKWLDPLEIGDLLHAYQMPSGKPVLVQHPEHAVAAASELLKRHSALVAKILSPEIVHKSDIGGVRLNLSTATMVRDAVDEILANARRAEPTARITGVTLHPMIIRSHARELIAGIADDPTFGPVIVFGSGGTAVEVINDKALALPPLDLNIARALMARTRAWRILHAYRDVPAADTDAVALILVKLAQMAADHPQIRELDLNPILVDAGGAIILDCRIAVSDFKPKQSRRHENRLTIRPYPSEWERTAAFPDGRTVSIRPIRPEDETLMQSFFTKITAEDLRLRFFAQVKDFSHTFIARLTQLDYSRAIAFVATAPPDPNILGVVRLQSDSTYEKGEFAILVRSDWKGRGLGWLLMAQMLEYAVSEGLKRIEGEVLLENQTMLKMCRELGFAITCHDGLCHVEKSVSRSLSLSSH